MTIELSDKQLRALAETIAAEQGITLEHAMRVVKAIENTRLDMGEERWREFVASGHQYQKEAKAFGLDINTYMEMLVRCGETKQ